MLIRKIYFICDGCQRSDFHYSISDARRYGWTVSGDERRCYCPGCSYARKSRNNAEKSKGGNDK